MGNNFKEFTEEELAVFIARLGQKPYRARADHQLDL